MPSLEEVVLVLVLVAHDRPEIESCVAKPMARGHSTSLAPVNWRG